MTQENKDLQIGDKVIFHCFDGSTVIVQITEINDNLIYGKSEFGNHWADLKNIEKV